MIFGFFPVGRARTCRLYDRSARVQQRRKARSHVGGRGATSTSDCGGGTSRFSRESRVLPTIRRGSILEGQHYDPHQSALLLLLLLLLQGELERTRGGGVPRSVR